MQTKPVTKPSKQRKMLFQAPSHRRHKQFAAPLSKELKASRGIGTLPVRTGDTVRVMRGDHRGFEGKITRVDRKKYRIYVEGLTRETVDGTAIFVSIHPSKVSITHLDLDDKRRKKTLERKTQTRKKTEKEVTEKILEEPKATKEKVAEKKTAARKKTSKKKTKTKERTGKNAKKEESKKRRAKTKPKIAKKNKGEK